MQLRLSRCQAICCCLTYHPAIAAGRFGTAAFLSLLACATFSLGFAWYPPTFTSELLICRFCRSRWHVRKRLSASEGNCDVRQVDHPTLRAELKDWRWGSPRSALDLETPFVCILAHCPFFSSPGPLSLFSSPACSCAPCRPCEALRNFRSSRSIAGVRVRCCSLIS